MCTKISCFLLLWEVENRDKETPPLSLEEKTVVEHFQSSNSRDEEGRCIAPLPIREGVEPLGESRP